MRNRWLAVDISTNPTARARQLRRAWEHFVDGAEVAVDVREPIVESWRRSAAAGVDPDRSIAPVELNEEEAREVWRQHPLARLAPIVHESLAPIADDGLHLVVVTDPEGLVLSMQGRALAKAQAAEEMNFVLGSRWSEAAAGTNAIGTALAADHALQVFAAEHYSERVQWWTCSAAPIHHPATGEVVGIVDLTARMETVHPHTLALVSSVAMRMDAHLRDAQRSRDGALSERYADALAARARGQGALLSPDGRVLSGEPRRWAAAGAALAAGVEELVRAEGAELEAEAMGRDEAYVVFPRSLRSRTAVPAGLRLAIIGRDRVLARVDRRELTLSHRHSELAALLAAHPAGMTGEALAIALYGDFGKPVTARAEVSRLKRLLGRYLQSEPYRFNGQVESDLAAVQELLEEGRTLDAASRYAGPVLPRSDAPGIVALRQELEGWIRRSVMAADDVEALWVWLQTPSGEDDATAWRRFLTGIPYDDGRRGLAATRLQQLRDALTVET
ncbi:MAG TPA: GAF domain-containing protein [Solirubrobacteraceae bacterium]|jgi:hypothetical protein|nr:GAF domain-containing protein [Solirubrobacteraceae bacterium]